jgi:hypothetical protein
MGNAYFIYFNAIIVTALFSLLTKCNKNLRIKNHIAVNIFILNGMFGTVILLTFK